MCRFDVVDGHGDSLVASSDDWEWTLTWRTERGSRVFSYEDLRAVLESWRHVYVLLPGGSRRSAAYPSHPFAELLAEGPWLDVTGLDKEISRKCVVL